MPFPSENVSSAEQSLYGRANTRFIQSGNCNEGGTAAKLTPYGVDFKTVLLGVNTSLSLIARANVNSQVFERRA